MAAAAAIAVASARPLTLTVFGATGRTGRRIVETALDRGHIVRAFARDPAKLDGVAAVDPGRLEVIRGDARDAAAVAAAVAGSDAVLSALGVDDFRNPGTFLGDAMVNITAGMVASSGVRRILAVAGAGILDAGSDGSGMLRSERPTFPAVFRAISAAHRGTWDALRAHGEALDWTLVCTPDLIDGPAGAGTVLEAADTLPASTNRISVGDVAAWMLDELAAKHYLRRRVGLCY